MCHNIKTWIWAAAAGPETADIGTDDTFVFKILAKIAHSCTQLYTYNIQYVQTAVDMLRNGGQGVRGPRASLQLVSQMNITELFTKSEVTCFTFTVREHPSMTPSL